MALELTHGQVAQQVSSKCDTVDEDRRDAIMASCLQEIFNAACECPIFQVEGTITLKEGETKYPLQLDDGTKLRAISRLADECNVLTCQTADECDTGPGSPRTFTVWGNQLDICPTPDVDCPLSVRGYRGLDCTLYTDSADGKTRTWQPVDLPSELHTAYQHCVIGLSLAEAGDYEGGEYWISKAGAAVDAVIAKKEDGPITSSKGGLLRSESWCHKPTPCCDTDCCNVTGTEFVPMDPVVQETCLPADPYPALSG